LPVDCHSASTFALKKSSSCWAVGPVFGVCLALFSLIKELSVRHSFLEPCIPICRFLLTVNCMSLSFMLNPRKPIFRQQSLPVPPLEHSGVATESEAFCVHPLCQPLSPRAKFRDRCKFIGQSTKNAIIDVEELVVSTRSESVTEIRLQQSTSKLVMIQCLSSPNVSRRGDGRLDKGW